MAARDFNELVSSNWDEKKFLCIGLDSDARKLPGHLKSLGAKAGVVAFNTAIVETTRDIAAAFKLNTAFYEANGEDGWAALAATCQVIRESAPDVPIIIDAKRADIGNTNEGYVEAFFTRLGADALTVHPYLGAEALAPFLMLKEKGIIILCRTSNHGSGELQDLEIGGEALYMKIAHVVEERWNKNRNCWLVVGATYPKELREIRSAAPNIPFLIPGVGAQGGDASEAVKAGIDSRGRGILLNASRSVIFASSGVDFAERAREQAQELHGAILQAL